MQHDKYSTGPDNRSIDKLKVLSLSIVTGITKFIHYFGADIVSKLRYKVKMSDG